MKDNERGLGHLVYGANDGERQGGDRAPEEPELVEEASEESFPASDPPSYTRGTSEHTSDADDESPAGV